MSQQNEEDKGFSVPLLKSPKMFPEHIDYFLFKWPFIDT